MLTFGIVFQIQQVAAFHLIFISFSSRFRLILLCIFYAAILCCSALAVIRAERLEQSRHTFVRQHKVYYDSSFNANV